MVNIVALLSRSGEHLGSLLPLAVVPFALAVVSVEKFRRIAESGADLRFGVSFGLPTTVTTSWDFLSLPNAAPGLNLPTGRIGTTALVMLVVAVLSALLGAGYLGSIRRELAGLERDFPGDARTYFGPFLGFELLRLAFVLAALTAALVALPLVVVVFLALFVFAYLFYATPYLVVVEGVDLPTALRRSYGYATSSREYASFFVQYLLAVAVVSVLATPLFATAVPGAALGTVLLAPVALLFNIATVLFVRDLTGATGHEDDGPAAAGNAGTGGGTGRGSDVGTSGTAQGAQSNMPVEM